MNPTIFFSWQSDSEQKYNRNFLKRHFEHVAGHLPFDQQYTYDEATRGVPGTPDIPSSIFTKIENAAIAIFDVSIVRPMRRNKGLINPNVAIELGFAAHAIGWDRIICIMNTASGDPELLPFDLKQRRFPLTYRYSFWSAKPDNSAFRAQIVSAVSDALSGQHKAIERAKGGLSVECVQYIDKLGQGANFNVNGLQAKQEIDRLLDLGLIRFDVAPQKEGFLYSYHWTYLGRALCDWYREERIRNGARANEVAAAPNS